MTYLLDRQQVAMQEAAAFMDLVAEVESARVLRERWLQNADMRRQLDNSIAAAVEQVSYSTPVQ